MNPLPAMRTVSAVLATDGCTESDSALTLGHLLAGPTDGIRVVAVEGDGLMDVALGLVRRAGVPVLATSPDLDHAPRRIVVGIDFSETSLRAARLALRVAGFGASVYLVHVVPRDQEIRERTHEAILELFEEWEREDAAHACHPNDALHDLRDRLQVPAGTTVRLAVLHGDPATELLAFASGIKADLIAAGANGHGFVSRLVVGRVASRLVRHSRRSVLIAPHVGATAQALSA